MGKTSLKRSLKGERFNPEETSTEGIEMDPSYCNVSKELWKVGDKTQSTNADPAPISYEQRTAQFILTSLKEGGKEPKSNKMKNDAVLMHDETPSFTEDESSRETGSLTREATPEIPAAELPEFQEVLEVPEEIAALIKKLLQVVDNGNDEEDMYATLWDFGGQSVYYATHPLFLTTRAIYFLVYNLSRNPNEQVSPQVKCGFYKNVEDVFCERSNMDYLDIWMSSVSNLVSQDEDPQEMSASETLPERLPPVFLVCTHADKFQNSNPNELAREIFGSLKTRSYGKHLVDVFVVDNTKSGRGEECPGVTSLRNEVQTLVNELPQMKEAIPIKWLKYEKAVKVMLEDGYKWIPLEQARQIALEVCGISSAEQFLALLNFLHDQRILIHFDDTPQLNKMVILDPQWLIDVFKKVITIRPYHSKERKYEKLWLKLETTGMLEEKLLQHVWGPLFDNRETCDSLIAMMEKFCLLCPWSSSTESESPNEYLVPSMLMFPPQEDITKLIASARIPSLFLKFKSTQVPSGLFPRLVLMVFQWCIKELSSQSQAQLHQNFARFYTHPVEGCSIILICHSSFIEVVVHKERSVVGLSTDVASGINLLSESKYDAFQVDFARAVCRQLGLILECMRKEFPWLKNIAYDFLVCCPVCCTRRSLNHCRSHNVRGCKEEQCLHLLSESQLRACLGPIVCTRAVSAVNCRVPVNCVGFWFRSLDEQQDIDGCDVSPLPSSEEANDKQALVLSSGVLEALATQTCDAGDVVAQLQESLSSEQISLRQPDPDTKKRIRYLCLKAKTAKRLDVVKKLREIAPAGTTGPLLPEAFDVANIPFRQRQNLTMNLCGGDEWKFFAERLGLTPAEIRYLDNRVMNPCDAALAHARKQGYVRNVGDLYDILVDCEFPIMADFL